MILSINHHNPRRRLEFNLGQLFAREYRFTTSYYFVKNKLGLGLSVGYKRKSGEIDFSRFLFSGIDTKERYRSMYTSVFGLWVIGKVNAKIK